MKETILSRSFFHSKAMARIYWWKSRKPAWTQFCTYKKQSPVTVRGSNCSLLLVRKFSHNKLHRHKGGFGYHSGKHHEHWDLFLRMRHTESALHQRKSKSNHSVRVKQVLKTDKDAGTLRKSLQHSRLHIKNKVVREFKTCFKQVVEEKLKNH